MQYSIVNFSEVNEHYSKRFDAEFFEPEYFKLEEKILKNKYENFGDLIQKITGGATPLGANYLDDGIPFLRVQNIMQNYFLLDDVVYISKEDDNKLKRSKIKERDVLLTITGVSYGKSATATKDIANSNMNQHSVKIEVDQNIINPYFLSTFLNSKFGKKQSDRNIVGLSRPALDYESIKLFKIPIHSQQFQEKIAELVNKAYELKESSKNDYKQAEDLLLNELDLKNYKPEHKLCYVKNFSDTKIAERIDAEYFQPKYDYIVNKIKSVKYDTLENFVEKYTTGFPYKSSEYKEKGVPIIKIANIEKGRINLENNPSYITEEYSNISQNDVARVGDILISMSGTIGNSAKIDNSLGKCCINQRVFTFTPKDIVEVDYLVLFLNSIAGYIQFEKIGVGGVQTNISSGDIMKIYIPILLSQNKIANLVQKSFADRKKSKQLLEIAKKAVEIAIEENEDVAMKYIKENI